MSECLNYPNLTTLSSLVGRYRGRVWRETGIKRCHALLMTEHEGHWWVFILHKLLAVSVFRTVRLYPDGVCGPRTDYFNSFLWFIISFWSDVL